MAGYSNVDDQVISSTWYFLSVRISFILGRRPPRSTPLYSSSASDVYKRQDQDALRRLRVLLHALAGQTVITQCLSLKHISEPTRLRRISYAVFCLKKKKKQNTKRQLYRGQNSKLRKLFQELNMSINASDID